MKNLRNLYRQFNIITIKNSGDRDRLTLNESDRLILNGSKSPSQIDPELCKKVGEACDVRFLNRLGNADRQKKLLLGLLDLPAGAEATLRTLWLTWLSEQEPSTLKKELYEVADRLVSADSEPNSHLDNFLLKTLQKVGERYNDESLLALKKEVENSNTPWHVIADQASDLVARETSQPRPDHMTNAPKGNGASRVATKLVKRKPAKEPDQADAIDGSGKDIHFVPKIAPPKSQEAPQSERDILAGWIIAQRLSIIEVVDQVTKPMQETGHILHALRGGTLNTSSLGILRNTLSGLQKATAHALQLFPTLEEIDPIITESETLVVTLKQKLGRDPLSFLNQEVSLDALREVAHSEPLLSILGALPDWVVPPLLNGLSENPTDRLLVKCLQEDTFRKNIERLGENLARSGEDPGKLLESVPPPSPELDAVNYLSDWVDRGIKTATEIAHRLRDLTDRVSAEVAKAVTEKVAAATDDESRLAVLDKEKLTLEKIEEVLGEATTVTVRQWDRAGMGVGEPVVASPRDTVHAQRKLTISHNYVDGTAHRVDAIYLPYDDPNMPYGSVTVPLVLESRAPLDIDLELELRVLTDQRNNWPSDWKNPEPHPLNIQHDRWKEVGNGRYQWSFRVTIPIRDPSGPDVRDNRFRVAVKVYSDSGEISPVETSLVWDQLKTFRGMPELDWPDGVKPDYVKKHPVGRQAQADKFLKRLRSEHSFAVTAPRRFGKSTLVDYIAREAEQDRSGKHKLLVLKPLVCTRYSAGDRAAVWKDVSARFVDEIGVGLTTTEHGDIPSTNDMKRVRTAAWKSGYQGIVLLLDEAQLFFAGRGGSRVGDRLKDALEREWTCQPEQELASVQIGLVGLPSLLDRAGTNLMTALQAASSEELRPEELNRILLAVSQGQLQTTRAARQELASRTGRNLFILKTMVQRIQERLNEEKRLWFNDHDVVAAFSDARESLERGSEQGLADYLLDSLNKAESVNDLDPKPCYPLAVALARFDHRPQSEERMKLAVEEVQRWCANLSGGEGSYTSYTKERSKEDMEELRELDVYIDGAFRSELLEGHLRYKAKTFPKEEDKQAIIRCGVERIWEPESLEFVERGGQAEIYRFQRNDAKWAWRQIELSDSRANEVFLATQEALHKLRDLQHKTESKYLYDLRQVGVSEKGHGVEVYRWIDGVSLDRQVHTFSKEAVVDIGFKVGQAIKLIHNHDILHRDISPRNIILTNDAIPVLVDFGLARAANREMRTVIGGENAPPEVQGGSPNWTKAADIYGFGHTLLQLLKLKKGEAREPLYDLLDSCCSDEPGERPDAGELLQGLENIQKSLHVQKIRKTAWRKIETAMGEAGENRNFKYLLEKFQPQFEGIAIGLYPDRFEQCIVVADFLYKTVEAFGGRTNDGQKLTLGKIKRAIELEDSDIINKFGKGPGIKFAHTLRGGSGHFKPHNWKEEVLREFSVDKNGMHALMLEAATQIKEGINNLLPLVTVVETVFSSSTRQRDT